jgi:hypothetical protein
MDHGLWLKVSRIAPLSCHRAAPTAAIGWSLRWAGKHLLPVEALDARHPDPEEAGRIHGRQLARASRQRAAERGGLQVAVVR